MKRINTGYYLKEGFRSVFSHGFMSFASICMIVACLLIMGTFSLVAVNLEHNLSKLEDENEFVVYIDETLDEAEARGIQTYIEAVPNVSEVSFVTREQAGAEFIAEQNNALFEGLPDTTFRHRFYIHVMDIEQLRDTVQQVINLEGIADYSAAFEVADGFVAARNVASGIAAVLIAILFFISLFIISNTIKLATFTRREEIAIMKMCGATNGFVRWPFVFEGFILGIVGAGLGFVLQWGVYKLIADSVTGGSGLAFIEVIPFEDMFTYILPVFGGAGFLIGVGGSLLAIRKFLQV